MRRIHKKWLPWIIIICIGAVMLLRRRQLDGFQSFKIPKVDINIKDPIISENIMTNYKENCQILFDRIGEVHKVKSNLDNIKAQINTGAVNVKTALLKLQTIYDEYLMCKTNSPLEYCSDINRALIKFQAQMNPQNNATTGLADTTKTTVAGLNALINNEYENILSYSQLINTMKASLRCDMSM